MKRYLAALLAIFLICISTAPAQESNPTTIGIWLGGASGGIKTPDLPFVADYETGWFGSGGLGLRLPIKIYDLSLDAKATFSGRNTFRYCGELNFIRPVYRQVYAFAGPNINFWHLQYGADSKGGAGFQIGAGVKGDNEETSNLMFEMGFKYTTGQARGWVINEVDGTKVQSVKYFNFHDAAVFVRLGILMSFSK